MDSLAETKATEFERRASRRISRGISIHDGAVQGCGECGGQEDLIVADGFQPGVSESGTSNRESATDSTETTASSSSGTEDAGTDPEIEDEVEEEVVAGGEGEPADESDNSQQSQPEIPPEPAPAESLQPPIVRDRPRSIAKPPEPTDSFALRHDGAISSTPDRTVMVDRNSHPSNSPDSQPATPSGPSFPYDIYAQHIGLARTMSATTVTTLTAPASPISEYPPTPTSPLGPSHPYGMYPQTTTAGPSTMPLHGPVGFQGMPDNYRRRVGPDGEVLNELVGPDGHTEQLPPYSRYPDEASVRRARDVAASSANALASASSNANLNQVHSPILGPSNTLEQPQPPASPTLGTAGSSESASPNVTPNSPAIAPVDEAAVPPLTGAGGIGLAARNPEFDSDNGRDSSRSQHSTRSFTSESENSGQRINGGANNCNGGGATGSEEQQPNGDAVSEKRGKKPRQKKWQRYARRRAWGIIPYWAICFFITLVIFIGIVAGAVVGTLMDARRRGPPQTRPPQKHGGYSGTVSGPPIISVTVDATPIPIPTDLQPLAIGSYSLPLGLNKSPASCFNDSTQSPSWSCGIWFGSGMTITVDQTPALVRRGTTTGPGYSVGLTCNQTSLITGNVFWYGQQPPAIPTPLPMEMVSDISDPGRGPAWFKMVPYDKTVIIQESMLTTRAPGAGGPPAPTTTGAASGDIEKRRRARIARAYGGPPGDFHRKGLAQVGDRPWVCTWPDTLLEVFIYPNQNTSWQKYAPSSSSTTSSASLTPLPGSSASSQISSLTSSAPGPVPTPNGQSPTSSDPSPTSSSPSSSTSPGAPYNTNTGPWVPPYPRVVKVLERRMARARQAYCRQYEIKPEGNSQPLLDQNGDFVEFNISEEESGPAMVYSSGGETSALRQRSEDAEDMLLGKRATGSDLSDCGCLWMLT